MCQKCFGSGIWLLMWLFLTMWVWGVSVTSPLPNSNFVRLVDITDIRCLVTILFVYLFIFSLYLATLHDMWNLNFPNRDRTYTLCMGNAES